MPEALVRRGFIRGAAGGCALFFAEGCSGDHPRQGGEGGEPDVSPTEDLMREHGALDRILLIYEETIRRVRSNEDPKLGVLSDAAEIVRRFIEGYHEKLEEDHLFPRFERAGRFVPLVRTLRAQHEAGRRLTASILDLSRAAAGGKSAGGSSLVRSLELFVRMYRPHEAREDTVLFPALHQLVGAREFDALGEDFEKKEHALFGASGFEGVVAKIGELERLLGIDDLDRVTPR